MDGQTPISIDKLGADNNRIWTLEKDSARVKLLCNGVVIYDIEIEASDKDSCGNLWSHDFAGMRFMDRTDVGKTKDTASDFFRQYTNGKRAHQNLQYYKHYRDFLDLPFLLHTFVI